jgi:acetyl-CoA carboxylase biotin carboxyl carrier protein
LLHESELAEISLETTDTEIAASRLTVRRQVPMRAPRRVAADQLEGQTRAAGSNGATATPHEESSAIDASSGSSGAPISEEDAAITIAATAVGVFRSSQPPVKVGDAVKTGQVVGIVESLKIPNEVMAPVAGSITEVIAAEGQAVEYGQPLLLITPSH